MFQELLKDQLSLFSHLTWYSYATPSVQSAQLQSLVWHLPHGHFQENAFKDLEKSENCQKVLGENYLFHTKDCYHLD